MIFHRLKMTSSSKAQSRGWNTTYEGQKGVYDTNTNVPGSAGSSWYFLRYLDPQQ